MDNTDYTKPYTAFDSSSQSRRLAQRVAEIRESVNKMTLELLHAQEEHTDTQDGAKAQEAHLRWLNGDSLDVSVDKVLSQEFSLNNLADLLGDIHSSLFGTVLLMRNMDGGSALPGFVIQMIGDDMQKKLDLLLSVQNYCAVLQVKSTAKEDE